MTNRIRIVAAALLFLGCLVTLTSAFNLPNRSKDVLSRLDSLRPLTKPAQHRTSLTFADRVAYQRAIEDVYWRHRIWPKERPDPKPSLDAVMSQAQLEKKVEDYLRNSQALEDYWQKPISAEQLQAEVERMAQHTKQPQVLHELFEALGNDPFAIAECLARPALSERLLTDFYAHDERFHGELKQRAETDLQTHRTVQQMKQNSGTYSEIELVKNDSAQDEENHDAERGLKLNSDEWDETVQKLAATFGGADIANARSGAPKHAVAAGVSTAKAAPIAQIKTGELSSLQEDETRYYAIAIVKKSQDRLKVATVEWRKEPLESWAASAERQTPKALKMAGNYRLPNISNATGGCTNDTWTATSARPDPRAGHSAVWSGSEMIVWGGDNLNTGGRYNPATDNWTVTSTTNAPGPRTGHTAVWTGSEMIVWGGGANGSDLNTGGRYNPATDTWTATSNNSAPTGRSAHTAVWSGSQMIIWGGYDGVTELNTGGRYNPGTDGWTATSTTNAPVGRYAHTAVWSGSQMIVWGGVDTSLNYVNTGGRYNPGSDTWMATSTTNAPAGRLNHTAVWSGSEMIIWGGDGGGPSFNSGGKYNPVADSWTATTLTNAPEARSNHTAVWTGAEMTVWGGFAGGFYLNTGGRYNPATNSWTATSTTNAPTGRSSHTAIWSGSEMIVWGGTFASSNLDTGGRYNPATDSWATIGGTPPARNRHTAVWTGSEMVVWGGRGSPGVFWNTGGRYDPSTDTWTTTSTINAPSARYAHTAVWSGIEMIVWGGLDASFNYLNTGGRYNPGTDSWTATNTANAPTGRYLHTAVWTDSEMIVWGGFDGNNDVNTGGRYNPSTDSWTATSMTNAPSARESHTAAWTSSELIIWGGYEYAPGTYSNTGGRYNPGTDSWTPTSTTNAPDGRASHTAIWTDSEMIVWGGYFFDGSNHYLNTGGRYNPGTDNWAAINNASAPSARASHTVVWTGSEMIVWGGHFYDGSTDYFLNTGGRYNRGADSWISTSLTNAPAGRWRHTAVWDSSELIVWGGATAVNVLSSTSSGGRYCAQSAPMAQSAVSRKTHGGAGMFDINLPLSGTTGVESRSGGATHDYTMVVTFSGNVAVTGTPQAQVTMGSGCVGTGGACDPNGTVSITGNVVTIPLTAVADVQTINLQLNGVMGATDAPAVNVTIPMSVLIGDVNGNRAVNSSDVALTKSQAGHVVGNGNFREDVNASGTITATDVAIVKSDVGHALPP